MCYLRETGEAGSWKTLAGASSRTAESGLCILCSDMGNHSVHVLEQHVINALKRSLATVRSIVAKDYRQGRNFCI